MANPNLLSSGKVADLYGQGMKFVVTLADLQAIGAATSGNIILDQLPAGAVVLTGRIKHSIALAGAGPVTAATAQLTTTTGALPGAAFNVFQAVGDTVLSTFQATVASSQNEAWSTVTALNLAIVLTGGNASGLTAGRIEAWVRYVVLK